MTAMKPVSKTVFGTSIQFFTSTPFTSVDGVAVYPDQVILAFSVNGGEPVVFTYTEPEGDPSNTIVKDVENIGYYAAIINTGDYAAGLWQYSFIGKSTGYAQDITKTNVRYDGSITVIEPPFALP
jgi:hypothetical protein